MKISVLLFANIKEYAGTNMLSLDIQDTCTVQDLKDAIAREIPETKNLIQTTIVSINHEFAFPEDIIPPDAEIAVFPPVSGGQKKPNIIKLTDQDFQIDKLIPQIVGPTNGAICMFSGVVREFNSIDNNAGSLEHVTNLIYEAYEPMATNKMCQVASEIRSKWPNIFGIAIIQRIGELEPSQKTIMIACTGAHRNSGVFEAARYGIDRLKEIVPIWKKELDKSNSAWIQGAYIPNKNDN